MYQSPGFRVMQPPTPRSMSARRISDLDVKEVLQLRPGSPFLLQRGKMGSFPFTGKPAKPGLTLEYTARK